jgi:hypothetical protein
MPQFEERKKTMDLRVVAHRVWMGPAPFDFKIKHKLQQKVEVTRGGFGKGTEYFDEWVDIPVVSEEMVK